MDNWTFFLALPFTMPTHSSILGAHCVAIAAHCVALATHYTKC